MKLKLFSVFLAAGLSVQAVGLLPPLPPKRYKPVRPPKSGSGAALLLSKAVVTPPLTLTLAWSPPASTNVITNYTLYFGGASRAYTNSQLTASTTSGLVAGLARSANYYFAVTATDSIGLTSDYSAEVHWPSTNQVLFITGTNISFSTNGIRGPWVALGTNVSSVTWSNWQPPSVFWRGMGMKIQRGWQ